MEHVNHPEHYNAQGIEVIEMMVRIWGKRDTIAFCELNAFKYRMRMGRKPGQPAHRDLEKAMWYESKAQELNEIIN